MEQLLAVESSLPALYMFWSSHQQILPSHKLLPKEYELRQYQVGDEQLLYPLFVDEGWNIDDQQWGDYLDHILPRGLFLLWYTPHNQVVGTAGAIHNPRAGRYYFPFGGELAYLVLHPDHRGFGLGRILVTSVLERLQSGGYETIWLGVQGFRLPAIKTYLQLGFLPLLHQQDLPERWLRICKHLQWPYTPDTWPTSVKVPTL